MPMRHLIVGSGIAALSAAEAIRRCDASARITLVSEETHPFYTRPGLAYLLSGAVPESQLRIRSEKEIAALRVERVVGRVAQLVPAQHEVVLANGRVLGYDRLLLALGAGSIVPEFPGAGLPGVVRLDGLDDAHRILKRARRGGRAIVVGGGSTALELVEGFHARGMHTSYFLRGERYWGKVLDAVESAIIEERLEAAGIEVHRHTEVARALPNKKDELGWVETRAKGLVPCDLLAIATGVRPRTEIARSAGLSVDRGIRVNEFLETSDPDVFAAGDVAQVHDPVSGRALLDTLWSSAEGQGRVAGENMAGGRAAYRKRIAFNVTCLAGLITTIVGDVGVEGDDADLLTITRGQSEAWSGGRESWSLMDRRGADRVRIQLGDHQIVGAVILGDQALSDILTQLITEQVDITPIREALVQQPATMMAQLTTFYQAWERTRPDVPGGTLVAC